ncbi:hypothetical protein HX004_14110 [Myroides sp. 1354]|uniref:hypothetical protein n=1 Tax=unclassified Myroides TaxID=2642485 RepID=UPI0025784505|nr:MULTISPECIES: hypothetical protein [unclassified Myroides]MDM1045889.1 hypothetical protein [Myroides sp. R163-1]MDM1056899.1 hypothetical protein [Myroides sp. 1354]MDM1070094.1 hypothetical protein [Myroides sp. 1372]
MNPRIIGIKINKLRRYQLILDLYNKYKSDDVPTTVVWRKHIYPVYPISRTTLYEILGTPVKKELAKIEEQKATQMSLF